MAEQNLTARGEYNFARFLYFHRELWQVIHVGSSSLCRASFFQTWLQNSSYFLCKQRLKMLSERTVTAKWHWHWKWDAVTVLSLSFFKRCLQKKYEEFCNQVWRKDARHSEEYPTWRAFHNSRWKSRNRAKLYSPRAVRFCSAILESTVTACYRTHIVRRD